MILILVLLDNFVAILRPLLCKLCNLLFRVRAVDEAKVSIDCRADLHIHSFNHSFRRLSCDRSIAPVLHTVRTSASSVNFQYRLLCLTSSTSCLRLLPRPPFPCYFSFNNAFQQTVLTQHVTNHLTLCAQN